MLPVASCVSINSPRQTEACQGPGVTSCEISEGGWSTHCSRVVSARFLYSPVHGCVLILSFTRLLTKTSAYPWVVEAA